MRRYIDIEVENTILHADVTSPAAKNVGQAGAKNCKMVRSYAPPHEKWGVIGYQKDFTHRNTDEGNLKSRFLHWRLQAISGLSLTTRSSLKIGRPLSE